MDEQFKDDYAISCYNNCISSNKLIIQNKVQTFRDNIGTKITLNTLKKT